MRKFLLAATAALALTAGSAFAQSTLGVPMQQTAARLDAATFLQGPAGGVACGSTVSTTAANDTVTITPPAGQFVYITGVYMDQSQDATGATQTLTVSTTNITGAPFWGISQALSTVSQPTHVADIFSPPLKSAASGVAVTFVPSATQGAHNYLCIRVAGYFSPQ